MINFVIVFEIIINLWEYMLGSHLNLHNDYVLHPLWFLVTTISTDLN